MSRRPELTAKRMRFGCRRALYFSCLILPVVLIAATSAAQTAEEGSIELVDPKVLRVCADPRDLPFSNEAGEGFENKIAELLAQKLGKTLSYEFYPGATGFVRNTLNAHHCDVIMGMPQGDDIVQGTNPYYRTTYALVSKKGSGLEMRGQSRQIRCCRASELASWPARLQQPISRSTGFWGISNPIRSWSTPDLTRQPRR